MFNASARIIQLLVSTRILRLFPHALRTAIHCHSARFLSLSDASRLAAGLSLVTAYGAQHQLAHSTRHATAFARANVFPSPRELWETLAAVPMQPRTTAAADASSAAAGGSGSAGDANSNASPPVVAAEPYTTGESVFVEKMQAEAASSAASSSPPSEASAKTHAAPVVAPTPAVAAHTAVSAHSPATIAPSSPSSATTAVAPAAAQASSTAAAVKPTFTERSVPSNPISRAFRFAALGVRLAGGTLREKIRRRFSGADAPIAPPQVSGGASAAVSSQASSSSNAGAAPQSANAIASQPQQQQSNPAGPSKAAASNTAHAFSALASSNPFDAQNVANGIVHIAASSSASPLTSSSVSSSSSSSSSPSSSSSLPSSVASGVDAMVGIAGDAILAQSSAFFTAGNAEVLANALCRLRGAALKLGQMLSIQACVCLSE